MLDKILRFRTTNILFLVSLLFVVGGWLWAHLTLRGIPQALILHFSSETGITRTGSVSELAGFALIGLVAVVLNFFLVLLLEERDPLVGHLLTAVTVFLAILLFTGFAAIINVNV